MSNFAKKREQLSRLQSSVDYQGHKIIVTPNDEGQYEVKIYGGNFGNGVSVGADVYPQNLVQIAKDKVDQNVQGAQNEQNIQKQNPTDPSQKPVAVMRRFSTSYEFTGTYKGQSTTIRVKASSEAEAKEQAMSLAVEKWKADESEITIKKA